jgi:membrane-associated protease RseP (regulator of RpoE activity)
VVVLLDVVAGYLIASALVPLLLVLPHELGHALVALLCGSREARVEIGAPTHRVRVRIGRLQLEMRPVSAWRWAWYGRAFSDVGDRAHARIAVLAAGPAASLACSLVYGALGSAEGGVARAALLFLSASGAYTFVVTALPLRYGRFFGPYAGSTSDGRRIVDLLRARRTVFDPDGQV